MDQKDKELATTMAVSIYPSEKQALLDATRRENLKNPFDVVRLMAEKTEVVKLRSPKKKS
jgi:hypothetical protein